jgi:hypothetical protein
MPSAAFAQDAEAAADVAEERVIIVQARRQNETLQEVPVTVTAIGGETLQRYNIDQVADITSRVPTLNVQVGGSGSGGQLSLRGVGSSNISAAFDSAVAFEYDGVVVSTMRLVQAGFFDVEQIDVLRGPQSLSFGKAASAVAFTLNTIFDDAIRAELSDAVSSRVKTSISPAPADCLPNTTGPVTFCILAKVTASLAIVKAVAPVTSPVCVAFAWAAVANVEVGIPSFKVLLFAPFHWGI